VIRDLHAARKITVILVTHDLREAVFLADRVFVMSSRPGRVLVERKIEIPRPRDLEVTFTQGFQDIVHEMRSYIVKARQ
jgi:NitT/TauT family transport system ATP-binding protein